ncbi:hypothetical protein MK489_16880 [Myxococcota bacterium]|nr:hypothetical protein [Myxococcota bacterium]
MRWIWTLVAVCLLGLGCDAGARQNSRVSIAQPTVRGYVMARWHEEIPDIEPGECPEGLNPTEADYFPEEWADFMAARKRIRAAGGYLRWDDERLPPDACQDPLVQPDPGFLTLDGPALVQGLDLDGVDSGRADSGGSGCAHDDFVSPDGSTGIDNQYWRLMGCVRGYRPNDLMDRLHESNVAIKEGAYGILLEITGLDDSRDDESVEVQFLSAAEPVTMNAVDDIMRNVSVTAHEETRFHSAWARARIENGILTSEPVDVRIKIKQQTSDNEHWFRDARIRAEIQDDGSLRGILGAYVDTGNLYSVLNDQNIGDRPQGRNAANARGFMCAGVYHAMPRVADGHPDPDTGECTSISTAIHFEAVPAFVIRAQLAMSD